METALHEKPLTRPELQTVGERAPTRGAPRRARRRGGGDGARSMAGGAAARAEDSNARAAGRARADRRSPALRRLRRRLASGDALRLAKITINTTPEPRRRRAHPSHARQQPRQ